MHIVGHSLGGKVAAVAALRLAEEMSNREEHTSNINTSNEGRKSEGDTVVLTEGQAEGQTDIIKDTNKSNNSRPNNKKYSNSKERDSGDIKILSLTMIDVSPVDYVGDEAFADVFRTLDIVDDLNGELPHIGSDRNEGSSSSSDANSERRGDGREGEGVSVRAMLNDKLGERVSDPMLKAFLLSSIQPKERERERDTRLGGLSTTIRALMYKIEASRNILLEQQRRAVGAPGSDQGDTGGDGRNEGTRTTDNRGADTQTETGTYFTS